MQLNQNKMRFISTPHLETGATHQNYWKRLIAKLLQSTKIHSFKPKHRNLKKKYGERFNFFEEKFSGIQNVMEGIKEKEINGFIFDIGISSMQLDNPNRGFSFQSEGSLDMRMDSKGKTAAELIENIKEDELADIIYHYGDERNSRKIASKIVEFRKNSKINNTLELATIVKGCFPSKYYKKHPATKTFQAIRIYLNNEIEELCAG